jgi:hypothetical protein
LMPSVKELAVYRFVIVRSGQVKTTGDNFNG